MVTVRKTAPSLALFVFPAVLAVAWAGPRGSGNLANFRVEAAGSDAGGEFCRRFRLSGEQAQSFFQRAQRVDARVLHDSFDRLPCWVRGVAEGEGGAWHWEVRAGGTARLIAPDGAVSLLGCSDCEAVLRGDERPSANPLD